MYVCNRKHCQFDSSAIKVAIDGANIFTFDCVEVKRLHDSEVVKVERANSDGFVLAWNKTWLVSTFVKYSQNVKTNIFKTQICLLSLLFRVIF